MVDDQGRERDMKEGSAIKRTTNKEICRSLPIVGLIAHIDEILTGGSGRPKICHFAFRDDAYLVEVIIQLLPGLVNGHDSC